MGVGGGVGGEVIVGGADGGGSGKVREAHSDVSIARPALKLPVLPAAARHASTSGLLVFLEGRRRSLALAGG